MSKKLIEVALPLEAINTAAAHEKMPGIGAHPRGLHLWWARRPFVAARAVIWSSLVDDPSAHPELYPTEEAQNAERQRLFGILEKLVKWENSNDPEVLAAAKAEILRSTNNNPPALLDPFAGGGAIPLEAQRLGLEAHAHDLNPVAVMINKAMIEIPPRFAGQAPVNSDSRTLLDGAAGWQGAQGLAADVQYYGEWMKREAFRRIGHLYPKVKVPHALGGGEATVIAWIWARTVKCPNPACGCEMPLASTFVLSKKKGKEAWVKPITEGNNVHFEVQYGKCPKEYESFKVGRSAVFKCPCCGEITTDAYVKQHGKAHEMGSQLMAVVGEGKHGRIYLSPDVEQTIAADVPAPESYPSGAMPENPRWFSPPAFGMTDYSDLFTNRQLTALAAFSSLAAEAQAKAEADAVAAGVINDHIALSAGGSGARAYGEAVGVYLAFSVDRLADFSTSVSRWSVTNEKPMNCFSKQAIPMTWDFPEANPMGNAVGSFSTIVSYVASCIEKLPSRAFNGTAIQFDAQSDCGLRNIMVSTDPPYYDNIGYADLSDFFYVWMRQSLKDTYPKLFRTMLVPKAEELVATPYRFEGSTEKARDFFEDGMLHTCQQIYQYAREDIPVTIYYAYKQSDTDEDSKTASTGWETMLSAIIRAGFAITGTWPMRTEQTYRAISMGTNALASSIVLVCRKRPADAPQTTRRGFIAELKRELRPALQKLQRSNIAPVDLAQSAIGPGMGVYSRYGRVLEADGSAMTVRSALQIINQELDVYFNDQDGELDANSRFCVDLYIQNAFNNLKFGDADTLARAKNTSVAALAAKGVLSAEKGIVRLLTREELPEKVDTREESIWLLCQQLTRAMETGGVEACAQIVAPMLGSNAERAKDLAYRLYTLAERKGRTQEGYAYNALVVAWREIQSRAAELQQATPEQTSFF